MNKLYEICKLLFKEDEIASELASILNTNKRTVQRWLNGQNEVPDFVYIELKEYCLKQQKTLEEAILKLS